MLLPLSTSSVMMTHFVNEDESIQYIHGTTIGLFLACFIAQKKSITSQPSSSRNDQHLISPDILHHLIRTKRLQEWNMGNDHYREKWHTFFKKFHHQYSGMQPYDHSIDTITSLFPKPKQQSSHFLVKLRPASALTRNDYLLKYSNGYLFHSFASLK